MPTQKSNVVFSIDLTDCRAHLFNINMSIQGAAVHQKLSLPVWTPGSYMVREFAQHIVSVKAFEKGKPIDVVKINKNTFQLYNQNNDVAVLYQVYAFDSSIRAAFIDDQQAFFNGTTIFFRPHDIEADYIVNLVRPDLDGCKDWQVATAMPKTKVDNAGFGSYQAHNYDELVDYPFQISPMKRLTFLAKNIPHEIVLAGDVRTFDETRFTENLKTLCENQISLFDNEAPFSSYLFIARFEEGGYGGLEHRNSSMLLSSPYCLPAVGLAEPDQQYRSFLGLCSHEYFHAWNVKKLKPLNFVKYDYDSECYTTMLWLFEGITSYYDDLCLKRSGLISLTSYLELLGKNYSRLLKNKGRHLQSVAQASFDAWIKFYRQNENSSNSSISYYLKGSFIGLLLDLSIRINSQNKISLDNVMSEAYKQYKNGISESDFFSLLVNMTSIDVNSFKQKYIYGTEELPIGEVLWPFGIDFSLVKDELSIDDRTKMSAFLGLKLRLDENERAIVSFVEHDGPAMMAGLSPQDEIIAINEHRLDSANMSELLAALQAGQSAKILYSRKKCIRSCTIVPKDLPRQICKLSLKSRIETTQLYMLKSWLGDSEATHLTSVQI